MEFFDEKRHETWGGGLGSVSLKLRTFGMFYYTHNTEIALSSNATPYERLITSSS
jgi:hypothetical protein